MSWDITRENVGLFFRKTHNPLIGFAFCFVLAILIQLTGLGIAIVIAGIIAGFLLKHNLKAIVITFAGGFTGWLALFGLMYALNPMAFTNSWLLVGQTIPAPQIFVCLIGGIITGTGGQLGSLFAEIAYPQIQAIDDGLPPGPTERIPTEELPRRKRIKRKQKKKKKKTY